MQPSAMHERRIDVVWHAKAEWCERALLAGIVLAFAAVIALSVSPHAERTEWRSDATPDWNTKARAPRDGRGVAPPSLPPAADSARFAALVREGAFDTALELLRAAPTSLQVEWWPQLFGAWAEREPRFARELAASCLTAGIEDHVFRAVVSGWAAIAPADAAAFALALPPGAARAEAFRLTLPGWVRQDPAAVAAALPRLLDPSERDLAATALVACTDTANRSSVTALAWAEAIGDPARRLDALARVVDEWLQHDAVAAANYLAAAPRLTDAERDALRAALRPRPAGDRI